MIIVFFGLFGPKSRNLLSSLSKDNFDNENFKFGTAKFISIGDIKIWVHRDYLMLGS